MTKLELRIQKEESSILGDIVRAFYDFMNNGKCSPSYKIISPVDSYDSVYAENFFNKIGRNFIVKKERLPFDLDIRAVLSSGSKVLIETTKIDFDALKEKLEGIVENREKSFFVGKDKIIQTRTQNVEREYGKKDLRTVSQIIAPYGTENLNLALETIDTLYNKSCFCNLKDVCTVTEKINLESFSKMEIKQKMDLQQIQIIEAVQSPKMSLGMKFSADRIRYLRIYEKTLKMNHSELVQFLRRG